MKTDTLTQTKTDTLAALGKIIPADQDYPRDAVHIAVAPATAGMRLRPGIAVSLREGQAVEAMDDVGVGIVDPYLRAYVQSGEKFWVFLYPGSITSLVHQWTHPAFAEQLAPVTRADVVAARERLERIASRIDVSYVALIDQTEYWAAKNEAHICFGDEISHINMEPLEIEAFWRDFETVTGKKRPTDISGTYFRCAC